MKNVLFLLLLLISSCIAYGQDLKISWQDFDGREFSITAPSGNFSYGMISGDRITYDYNDRVSKIGSVYIGYNYDGKISKVGNVYITYDYNGRVSKVGRMYITYDYNGRISRTSGSVL